MERSIIHFNEGEQRTGEQLVALIASLQPTIQWPDGQYDVLSGSSSDKLGTVNIVLGVPTIIGVEA